MNMFAHKKVEEKPTLPEQLPIKENPVSLEKPYLVTESEILRKVKKEDMPEDHQKNLEVLLERINKVRYAWGKGMTVTSGYRSMADHLRIYKSIASQRGVPYDESKVPMASKHLSAAAVDISDPDGKLFEWTKKNEKLLSDIGLWMEEKDDQGRVHFQIFAPKSGKRWFYP